MELDEYAQYVLNAKPGNIAAMKARRMSYVDMQKDAAAQYKQQLQQEGALIKERRNVSQWSGGLDAGASETDDEIHFADDKAYDETEEDALERTQSMVAARLQREQQRRRAKGQGDDHVEAQSTPFAAAGAASPFNKMLHVNVSSTEPPQARRAPVALPGHHGSFTSPSGASFHALKSKASSCKLHPVWMADEAGSDNLQARASKSGELHAHEHRKGYTPHGAEHSTVSAGRRATGNNANQAAPVRNRRVSTLNLHGLDVALASVAGLISPGSDAGSGGAEQDGPTSLSPSFPSFLGRNVSFTSKSSSNLFAERSNSFLRELSRDMSESSSPHAPPASFGSFGAGKGVSSSSPKPIGAVARGRRGYS